MTPDWGGNERDDETQSEGAGTIKTKSYGTIKFGCDTDQEIQCDIIRIYPVDGNEWACDLIIKRPFSKSVTIYGSEKSDALKNALNFVAGLSAV